MNNEASYTCKDRFAGMRFAIASCARHLRFHRKMLLFKFKSFCFKLRLLRLDLRLLKPKSMSRGIDVLLYLDEAYSKCSCHAESLLCRLRGRKGRAAMSNVRGEAGPAAKRQARKVVE